MDYRFTHLRFLVANFAECFHFYRDVMGWQTQFGDENGPYAEFSTGAVSFSIYQQRLMSDILGTTDKPARPAAQDVVLLSIAVENVDAAVTDLRAKGVVIVVPPTDRPVWALRTAHFRDPDGNLIEINHPIPMGE